MAGGDIFCMLLVDYGIFIRGEKMLLDVFGIVLPPKENLVYYVKEFFFKKLSSPTFAAPIKIDVEMIEESRMSQSSHASVPDGVTATKTAGGGTLNPLQKLSKGGKS